VTDSEFRAMLTKAFDEDGLNPNDLARRMNMSRTSMNRWRNGRNFPHPSLRWMVRESLEQMLIVDKIRRMTPDEIFACSVRAGVHNPGGTLTEQYGGEYTRKRDGQT
jgi:transcriptional regulator with XRE-family HTH domain